MRDGFFQCEFDAWGKGRENWPCKNVTSGHLSWGGYAGFLCPEHMQVMKERLA